MSFSLKFAEIIRRKKNYWILLLTFTFLLHLKILSLCGIKKKNLFTKLLGSPCFLFHSLKRLKIEHDPESFQVHKERNTLKPKLLFSNLFKLQNNQILHKLCW